MIELKHINKFYGENNRKIIALNDVSLTINKGEFTIILGPSGSGKSTLLNLLGGMDRPSQGEFRMGEKEISHLSDEQLSDYRRDVVGFVFQFYNLIPSLTALENVGIAQQLSTNNEPASHYLESVGLSHRKNNFPNQLSGGEMQRVSIARALAKAPKLLLCDEPTGALDSHTGEKILFLLKKAAVNVDTAVVMVTHNAEFAQYADKIIHLHDGKIKSIEQNKPLKAKTKES
ncbi:ABC transporter, ATP-binding protein [Enterococcus casseliflavus ATCC 12755]|uniref:ABC transporter, ATP-binding protein n=1 Tax=Enterococcus casseliflavus ATCC 12755 TaxID=888066 RepID=F0EMU1_ENTCA|nr:ABC transporter ATP-binding protein [Enterococcus casseliflavus]EGC68576.1 ABC transporter, ATP-binding protein [Enterococcus casseliflavus ATCC 12755]